MSQGLVYEVMEKVKSLHALLKQKEISMIEADWNKLILLLNKAKDEIYIDKNALIKAMTCIINDINHEIINCEYNIEDINYFKSLSDKHLQEITFKLHVKEELNCLINLIARAKVEIKNADFSDIVKLVITH